MSTRGTSAVSTIMPAAGGAVGGTAGSPLVFVCGESLSAWVVVHKGMVLDMRGQKLFMRLISSNRSLRTQAPTVSAAAIGCWLLASGCCCCCCSFCCAYEAVERHPGQNS